MEVNSGVHLGVFTALQYRAVHLLMRKHNTYDNKCKQVESNWEEIEPEKKVLEHNVGNDAL